MRTVQLSEAIACFGGVLPMNTRRLRNYGLLCVLLLLLSGAQAFFAQETTSTDVCPTVIEEALTATDSVCFGVGTNRACYGHDQIEAQLRPNASGDFATPGDEVNLAALDSIRLSQLNLAAGTWGVARLRILAAATSSRLEDTTLLLFGNVEAANRVPDRLVLGGTVRADAPANVNVRQRPYSSALVVVSIQPNTPLEVVGRSENGRWLHVNLPSLYYTGWVDREFIDVQGDFNSLRVDNWDDFYYGPMQAIALSSTSATSSEGFCDGVTIDGMMIQTPEGPAQIKLFINEVSIDLMPSQAGNTMLVQPNANNTSLSFTMLEGSAVVSAGGTSYNLIQGTQMNVQTDSMSASAPVAYNPSTVGGIAGNVPLPPPPPPQVIADNSAPVWVSDAPTNTDPTSPNANTTPGNSGNAPGQTGATPGQSGSAPGQSNSGNSGNPPGQSGGAPGNSGNAPGQNK